MIRGSNAFKYTPQPNFVGTDQYLYQAQDSTVNPSASASTASSFGRIVITVTTQGATPPSVTTPISVVPHSVVAYNDRSTTFSAAQLLAGDNGDTLRISTVRLAGSPPPLPHVGVVPRHPEVVLNADSSVTYKTARDLMEDFIATVSDSHGSSKDEPVHVTVKNAITIFGPHSVSTRSTSLTIRLTDLPIIDAAEAVSSLQLAIVGNPAHGTATFWNGAITYRPNLRFTGTDSFNYAVGNDEDFNTNATVVGTISVTVN